MIENKQEILDDLYSLYSKLNPKELLIEKKIEILYRMAKVYKSFEKEMPDDLIEDVKGFLEISFRDIVDYTIRNDLFSTELAVELMSLLRERQIITKITDIFIKKLNERWKEFPKYDEIIKIMFSIAYVCEENNVTGFREELTRMFLNTLLEIRDTHTHRLRTAVDIAKYFDSIDMKDQANTLLKVEIESFPLKMLIKQFKDISMLLDKNNLLNDFVEDLLIKIVKKGVSEEYFDDVTINMLKVYYENAKNERIKKLLDIFIDKAKVYHFILQKIHDDLENKADDSAGRIEKRKELFEFLYEKIKPEISNLSITVFNNLVSIHRLLETKDYSVLLNNYISTLKTEKSVNPDHFAGFLATFD